MEAAAQLPDTVRLARGAMEVEVTLAPVTIAIRRGGRVLLEDIRLWAADGAAHDQLITLTEGVVPHEEVDAIATVERAVVLSQDAARAVLDAELDDGRAARVDVALPRPDVVSLRLAVSGPVLRIGMRAAHAGARFVGLGARHGEPFDQSGRTVWLGADRRYTGPDCPPEMLEVGGIPQGDYAPAPWLLSDGGYALWLRTDGGGARFDLREPLEVSSRAAAGAFQALVLCRPTPAACLRDYLSACGGLPEVLPEWGYGHWKSRDVYTHQADVEDDFDGYRRHWLPLDAIVIDSPWETQYNTWVFNPHQFPDAPGLIARMRAEGVRTVVWVTPWVNLDSRDGQIPPQAESEALHAQPAPNYAPGAAAGHFVKRSGEPYVGRWWMGTGSPVDFSSTAACEWWRTQARAVLELGVEGIKADGGEGFYLPDDVDFHDGRTGAQAAWAQVNAYHRTMRDALEEVHPGRGVLFSRSGWTGAQGIGFTWGGDQASDFWSLRALVAATLSAAASGFSNWSHDVGGYLGERLVDRCPAELLIRWAQFGCFTPLMQAHGRFPQEAWTYDDDTLRLFREAVILHERLVPYIRAAAATAARSGLPIIRPLCLMDPGDPRGWEIADAYAFGPSLWVAPVLEAGAAQRRVPLPRGQWRDFWTGEVVRGGGTVVAQAPLRRIPVWVREGALVVTYPATHVAGGLGDTPELQRPLEATLWGRPPCGAVAVRLADGTKISWRRGAWSVAPDRPVAFHERA
jgi:alpha-glucosidase (family GH31 glycosyl hydrolase)